MPGSLEFQNSLTPCEIPGLSWDPAYLVFRDSLSSSTWDISGVSRCPGILDIPEFTNILYLHGISQNCPEFTGMFSIPGVTDMYFNYLEHPRLVQGCVVFWDLLTFLT